MIIHGKRCSTEKPEGWHNPYPHGEAKVNSGVIELVANKKFFLAYDQQVSVHMTAQIKLLKERRIPEFCSAHKKKKME